eukprot:15317243-Alexandrium_andersonii.AAC.1
MEWWSQPCFLTLRHMEIPSLRRAGTFLRRTASPCPRGKPITVSWWHRPSGSSRLLPGLGASGAPSATTT